MITERKPDIAKFCLNCGQAIERNKFGDRLESYTIYSRRKYCSHDCYRAMKKKTAKQPTPPPVPTIETVTADATREKLTAVEFMSREMNNPQLPIQYRIQLAQLLAPYETPKLAPIAKGKKEDKAAKAGEIVKGARFGQSQPPRLVSQ